MNQPKKTILVADDDPAILDALTLILEDAGYEVKTTTDGATLRDIQQTAPDLLLLDIWLSGWNGKEICAALKSEETTRRLPILLFSANKETQKIAQEVGADDFITKPFDLDDLLARVERSLS
jgi:DNA-binding response OmpR family regulator